MQRLAGATEHLDGDLTDGRVLEGNLRDLRRINRFSGGLELSRRAVEALALEARLPRDKPASLLDVGTGGADIPIGLIEDWRRRGRRLTVLGVDSRAEVLAAAGRERPAILAEDGLTLRVADGRTLPFEDGSFDFAHASLVLHHLDPTDAAVFVREMARVARRGVVINDLARGRLRYLGAWALLHVVTGNAFTRHDGPLSVRRAYSLVEARALLREAGLRIVDEEIGFVGHRWALAAVPA
jgi:ubiquinone/menaquinone biosynthesis C-methylase UbiE